MCLSTPRAKSVLLRQIPLEGMRAHFQCIDGGEYTYSTFILERCLVVSNKAYTNQSQLAQG